MVKDKFTSMIVCRLWHQMGDCMNYYNYTDEEIIKFIRDGDEDAVDHLMNKYKNLVRKKAKALYLIGGDKEDIIQEGMIGLYKAIRDYKQESSASFFTFAELCISRQIYTAIQSSNTKKNQPLNNYISFEVSKEEEDSLDSSNKLSMADILSASADSNPEEAFIDKERAQLIEETLNKNLSEFEKQVIKLYINDYNYLEIAGILKKEAKAIDNALQRIRRKLHNIIKLINSY